MTIDSRKAIKNNLVKRIFFIFTIALFLLIAGLVQVSSEEKVKYSDLEKEEFSDDDESQELLKEYYGKLLGNVETKFNTIATKGTLAILNITIDGKDKRIFTRLKTGYLFPEQQDLSKLITTENLIVLGNISLKGNLFFEAENTFGPRRFFGLGSTAFRYVDEGFSRLVNGEATVSINPVLRDLISSYSVFLSAEGLTRGIYVAEKTNSYFVVKGVNEKSNIAFSWMLRGVKKSFDEYLSSQYAMAEGIDITAEIYYDGGYTEIEIKGLDKISALVNETSNNYYINETNNNQTNIDNNSNNNQSIKLITGNLVDEFGLETDLGQILGDATPLPTLTDTTNDEQNNNENLNSNNNGSDNSIIDNETIENNNSTSNQTVSGNESIVVEEVSVLELTLYSVDEDFVISQVADVTELSLGQVKKLINFVYEEPTGFEDEIVDLQQSLDFIEKVNGSVIIRLG